MRVRLRSVVGQVADIVRIGWYAPRGLWLYARSLRVWHENRRELVAQPPAKANDDRAH